jgi:RimJ/RimL family protein N-acetyltransferase
MALPEEIRTERLLLRRWLTTDRAPFAEMNLDPEVMQHYSRILSREESDTSVDRIAEHFSAHGFGLWAVEIPGVTPFAGYVGLAVPRFEAPFTPCVEIGWRLARPCWGYGYATEAARATLAFAFDEIHLKEVVSFTVPANVRSRRVMERLGMTHNPRDDFEHPLMAEGHPLRRHVLYRKASYSAAEPSPAITPRDEKPSIP